MTSNSLTKYTQRPKDINELIRLYEDAKNKQRIASADDKIKYYRAIEKGQPIARYSAKTLALQKAITNLRTTIHHRKKRAEQKSVTGNI